MSLKKRLMDSDIAIHCDTFEKAEQLFKILDRWEVVWSSYEELYRYEDLYWSEENCYMLEDYSGHLSCIHRPYCKEDGYEIWSFEKFMKEYNKAKEATFKVRLNDLENSKLRINKKLHFADVPRAPLTFFEPIHIVEENNDKIIENDDMFTRNWTATWINKENMEEEIMRKNIKVENNKTILTFLTDGLTKEDLKISYFKKYEDEYKVDLKVEVIKGNQFVKEGFEQIITIDRIKITKKLNAKYNDGMVTIEFNNIDENIDVEFED